MSNQQQQDPRHQNNPNAAKVGGKVIKKGLKKAGKEAGKKVGQAIGKSLTKAGGSLLLKASPYIIAVMLLIVLAMAVFSLFIPDAKAEKITEYATVGAELGISPLELVAFDMVLYDNKLKDRNPNHSAYHFLSLLYEEYHMDTDCDDDGNCTTSEVVTYSETIEGKENIINFFNSQGVGLDNISGALTEINGKSGKRVITTILSADTAMEDAAFKDKQKEHFKEILESGLVEELYPELAVTFGYGGEGGYWGGAITEFGANEIPAAFIPIYEAAQKKYGVPWNLLAAHHSIETKFSTINPMISYVGAEGHLQFMPCTWIGWSHSSCGGSGKGAFSEAEKKSLSMIKKHGGYGTDANGDGVASMWDIEDAIHSAARYLAANGAAEGKIKEAVYAYNHASWYVEEVMTKASLYASGYVTVGGGGDYPNGLMSVKHVAAHYLNNYRISTPFAPGGIDDGYHSNGHFGLDLTTVGSTDLNDPIYSLSNGVVSQILPLSSTAGHGVRVTAPDGYIFSYIHMNGAPRVQLGSKVSVGQVLGGFGNSASGSLNGSGGVHLDLKIKNPSDTHIDPEPLLKKWAGDWWVKKDTNAYPSSVWTAPEN